MPAEHLHEISDDLIHSRLRACEGCSIEYTGRMPSDTAHFDDAARDRLAILTVEDVRIQLARHSIAGDSATEEVDMAISMAAEPADMPDNGCVALLFPTA